MGPCTSCVWHANTKARCMAICWKPDCAVNITRNLLCITPENGEVAELEACAEVLVTLQGLQRLAVG